jgi:cation diffusion facilitator family transporter
MIGVLVHSVSIKADGINNLTDAGSNIISILSFKLSEKPADKEHPYGHERTETITSLFVGMAIVLLGYEMFRQSLQSIIHPQELDFSWSAVGVLVLSIIVKLYMYMYNHHNAKVYNSSLLQANALDSRSDVLGTSAVLLSTLISAWTGYNSDGWTGLLVSGIIFYSAYGLLKDVINALIGQAPDKEIVDTIHDEMLKSDKILAVHDIIVHSYGQNSQFATAHAEVDASNDLSVIHDEIDAIEREVRNKTDIELTIHIDPMKLQDPLTKQFLARVDFALKQIDPSWQMHDFHVVETAQSCQLYFDLIVPFEEKRSETQIEHLILDYIYTKKPLEVTINLDHPFD